jgi:quaternary ammonium compound-resistance protein SugE
MPRDEPEVIAAGGAGLFRPSVTLLEYATAALRPPLNGRQVCPPEARGHDLAHHGHSDRDGPATENPVAWVYLLLACLLEVVWAAAIKQSEGFSRLGASAVTLVAMIASFWLLALAMRTLPLGTSYTIWTGIGAVGAFIVGITMMGEVASVMRIAAASLIVAGLVLMKLSSTT